MEPGGTFSVNYKQDIAIVRTRLQWGLLVAFLVFLFVIPQIASGHLLTILNGLIITLIAVHGLNILTGYCGQISLGQAAFMGVGAYASAILATRFGLSFWIALPCAALIAAFVGLIFGLPALRVKGFYLAMATLAAQFMFQFAVPNLPKLTGGTEGMVVPPITLLGMEFRSDETFFYVAIIIAIIMTIFAKNLARTKVGRAFIAIRDNDIAAEVMGVSLLRYKLTAFFICSFYAGVAGSLWAYYIGFIHVEHFVIIDSVWYLGMLVVGGMGSTMGAIFGVVFITALEELVLYVSPAVGAAFPFFGWRFASSALMTVFGVVIVLFLVFEPRGINHGWETFKSRYRHWPFSY